MVITVTYNKTWPSNEHSVIYTLRMIYIYSWASKARKGHEHKVRTNDKKMNSSLFWPNFILDVNDSHGAVCKMKRILSISLHDLTAMLLGNFVFSTDSVISEELMNFKAFFMSPKSSTEGTPSSKSLMAVTHRFKTKKGSRMTMMTAFTGTNSALVRSSILNSLRQRSLLLLPITCDTHSKLICTYGRLPRHECVSQ